MAYSYENAEKMDVFSLSAQQREGGALGQPIPQRILTKRFYAPAGDNGRNLDEFFGKLYEEYGDFRIIGVFPMNGCEIFLIYSVPVFGEPEEPEGPAFGEPEGDGN